jgi:alpha-glucosidase
VGGFNEAGNAELLVRWMQCGAMTPFFRNHTSVGQPDKYPWSFGPEVEELCREAIRLRYRFLPYLYAAFLEAAETGAPIQRPLVFEFQSDRQARDIEDEYLLGKALLVAPVCAPGKTRRSVYLPSGTWVDWHSGKVLEGPRRLTLDAPLQRIPLLLRGGHVLPLLPEAPESTQDLQPERIELHLAVPAGDGEFDSTLYEDDGLTFACRQGSFLRTALRVSRRGPRCTLAGAVTGKGYPEFRRGQFRLVVHGAAPARWRINGADATADGNSVVFRNAAEAFEVELELPRARMPRETEKL